jgi:heme-degrading monooxygenase HmoA
MFAVLFEVNPRPGQQDAYLGYAKLLRPELEEIVGFVDNVRYRSLTRPGWILSLSSWGNEKSLVRWRTRARHHDVQTKGRDTVLADYHLRVGQITADTHIPSGCQLHEQRLDVTDVGEGTTVSLSNSLPGSGKRQLPDSSADPESLAAGLGLRSGADGLVSWDVFEAVLEPGALILLQSWRDNDAAVAVHSAASTSAARHRTIRIVRDYGMFDRRENPQYYPDASPG